MLVFSMFPKYPRVFRISSGAQQGEIVPVAETPAPVVEAAAPLPEKEKKTTKSKKEEVVVETVSDENREDSN